MAQPVVQGTPTSGNVATAASSFNITLPTGGVVGELSLIVVYCSSNPYLKIDGYFPVYFGYTSTTWGMFVFAKNLEGNEGTTQTVTSITAPNNLTAKTGIFAWAAYRVSGATGVRGVYVSPIATGTSTAPNPPNMIAPKGSNVYKWIALYAWNGNVAHSTFPTNTVGNQTTNRAAVATTGGGVAIAHSTTAGNTTAFDPATGALAASSPWMALTIGLRPPEANGVDIQPNGMYASDESTPIPPGGSSSIPTDGVSTVMNLQTDINVPGADQDIDSQVEVKPTGQSFTNVASDTENGSRIRWHKRMSIRRGCSLEYDSLNDQYILFGGFNGTERFNDIHVYNAKRYGSKWRKVTTTGTPPTAINLGASAFYVSNGSGHLVIWGGNTGSDSNQMLILNTTTWAWRTVTQTSPPAARSYITKHLVPVQTSASNTDLYLFGGWGSARFNDISKVTVTDTTTAATWTTLKANGTAGNPTIRQGAMCAYDASTSGIIIHGGYSGTAYLTDTWHYSIPGNSFSQLTSAGAALTGRDSMSGAWDSVNRRLWIAGGWTGTAVTTGRNDIYSLAIPLALGTATATIERANASTTADNQAFLAHSSAASLWDPKRRSIVLGQVNGIDGTDKYFYVIDIDDTSQPAGDKAVYGLNIQDTMRAHDAPLPVVDRNRNELVFVGGFASMWDDTTIPDGDHVSDVWSYEPGLNRWRFANRGHRTIPPMEGQLGDYDTHRGRIIQFGGLTGTNLLSDETWSLTSDIYGNYQEARLQPTGTKPADRWLGAAFYDEPNDRMIFTMGRGVSTMYNDVWQLKFSTPTYSTYYFDAHNNTVNGVPEDPQNAWSQEDQPFDGNTPVLNTYLATSDATLGSVNNKYLYARGTTAPTSGGNIASVRVRVVNSRGGGGTQPSMRFYTGGMAERLTATVLGAPAGSGTVSYGQYYALSTPRNGWTWQALRDLEVRIWDGIGDGSLSASFSLIQLQVNTASDNNANGVWSQLSPTGTAPTAAWQPGYAYNYTTRKLYIYGGATAAGDTTYSSQLLVYDTATNAWSTLSPTGGITGRGKSLVVDEFQGRLWSFGGFNGTTVINTYQVLQISSPTAWTTVTPTLASNTVALPMARRSAGHAWMTGRFYLAHGRPVTNGQWFDDTYYLTPNYSVLNNSTLTDAAPKIYFQQVNTVTGLTANTGYNWQSSIILGGVQQSWTNYNNAYTYDFFTDTGRPQITQITATGVVLDGVNPYLQFSAVDPQGQPITYEIMIDTTSNFNSVA